ncbi:MAG: hypothetical protein R3F56_12965 [Planctomycetota bacterium]
MPQAIEHDLDYRDRGLVVVLPEVQGATLQSLPSFLFKVFPKLEARVVRGGGVPIVMGRGIPYSALIGVDGTLLWAGHPSSGGKERDACIEAELKKVATGWGESLAAKKVRAQLYGKQDLAEAKKLIDALPDDPDAERQALQGELAVAHAWRVRAVQALRDEARFVESKQAAQALKKSVAGEPEWETEATQLLADFDAEAMTKELAAAKKVDVVLRAVRGKKVKLDVAERRLRAVAKSAAGTAAGTRAEQLADALAAADKKR